VRGSLSQPVANGFLRFPRGANSLWAARRLRQLEANDPVSISKSWLVPEFSASRWVKGTIKGWRRGLGLHRGHSSAHPLVVEIKPGPHPLSPTRSRQSMASWESAAALLKPCWAASCRSSREASMLSWWPGAAAMQWHVEPVAVPQLVEEKWDFPTALGVVRSRGGNNDRPGVCGKAIPNFSYGAPERPCGSRLRPAICWCCSNPWPPSKTGGLLTLNGPIDRTLSGPGAWCGLLSGRLSFFTTKFTFDPDAP